MKFGTEALAIANTYENGDYYFTEWAARNGMNNDPSYAASLMLTHVDAAAQARSGEVVDRYTLSYAPTNGFWSDVWGTLLTKIGVESDSVLGLRSQLEYIQSSGQQVNWVVHSRGGVEFVQAAGGSSEKNLGNNSVVFHAGANTKPETTQMMDNKRIGDVINRDERYRDSPNDPVAQIIGLRALDNPLNFITSLFATPCVFLCDPENSPHTLPYQWNGLKQQGN